MLKAIKVLEGLSWGVAGRNEKKLLETLQEMGAKGEADLSHIPIIIADVSNEESLKKMAERAKVRVWEVDEKLLF